VVADAWFGQHMTASQRGTPTAASGVNVPVQTLRRYTGKYEMTTLGNMQVTVELQAGQLRLQVPGQEALPLRATSQTAFEVVGAPSKITTPATDGAVESITIRGVHPGAVIEKAVISPATRVATARAETYYTWKVEDGKLVIRHRRLTGR
jgi:hypothetical protein